jgi:hypothetical protein
MQNAEQLRTELAQIFEDLKNKKITSKEAAEFANLAGKINQGAKIQLEYYALRKEKPEIEFLNSTTKPK